MWSAVGVCALLVLVGLVVLWPGGGDDAADDPLGLAGDPVKASVESVEEVPCLKSAAVRSATLRSSFRNTAAITCDQDVFCIPRF